MNASFGGTFEDKTVLITGHTGFKGAWLSLWLDSLGARVVGYALDPPTDPSLFAALSIADRIQHIVADVRDPENLCGVFERHRPDFVFHLAAQSLVRFSYADPRTTYETNIMGTFNLLDAMRKSSSVRACLIVTSDKCYENREWPYSYRENDYLGGRDPYSSSKACAELVTSAVKRTFFDTGPKSEGRPAISTVRAGNVIGGGDWATDRLIPDFVRAFTGSGILNIRNPGAIRPWQHVLEPLSGYLWLAHLMYGDPGRYCGAWNFGPFGHDNLTVEELIHRFSGFWDTEAGITLDKSGPDAALRESACLRLDCTKAISLLHWRPVYNISEALEQTAAWYREFYSGPGTDIETFTLNQIKEYIRSASSLKLAWAAGGK